MATDPQIALRNLSFVDLKTGNLSQTAWTFLSGLPGLPATNTWTGDQYFKSGRPWFDVKAFGAVGNNSADDTTFIQNAITAANNIGGGIVFFPPGNYKISSTLTVKFGTILMGAGRGISAIQGGASDFNTINFDATCSGAGMEKLFVIGFQTSTAAQNCVTCALNTQGYIRDCYIWGGSAALFTQGADWCYDNIFFDGWNECIVSNGANWYIRCKLDTGALGGATPAAAFLQGTSSALAENHFVHSDFSGNFTNSVNINDGTGTHALTTFVGCVFSSPITITNAKASMFSACEIGSTTFTVGTNPTAITGCFGLTSITVSGAGKVVSGCINIS